MSWKLLRKLAARTTCPAHFVDHMGRGQGPALVGILQVLRRFHRVSMSSEGEDAVPQFPWVVQLSRFHDDFEVKKKKKAT